MEYVNLDNFLSYNKVKNGIIIYDKDDALEVDSKYKYMEIDDGFAYIIQQLNIKGYITRYCCSGHYGYQTQEPNEDDFTGGYIYFDKPYKFKNIPKDVVQDNSHILRFNFKSRPNTRERFDEINKFINNIADWVDELPNIN